MFTSLATLAHSQLEKWFPLQGERAHSLLFLYKLIERRRRKTEQQQQFTKGCNILHRLQAYTLIIMPFIYMIEGIYEVHIYERSGQEFMIIFFQLWVPMLLEHQF